jgi:Protein of unknown function (DUF669)
LRIVLEVIEGAFIDRKIFDNLNLDNLNQTAVEIGRRRLSQICHAVNMLQVRDSDQLHNKPLIVDLAIEPARDGYAERNKVLKYRARDGGAPGGGPAAPAPAARSNGGTAPWKKRPAAQ